jgi:hypothetical protein
VLKSNGTYQTIYQSFFNWQTLLDQGLKPYC